MRTAKNKQMCHKIMLQNPKSVTKLRSKNMQWLWEPWLSTKKVSQNFVTPVFQHYQGSQGHMAKVSQNCTTMVWHKIPYIVKARRANVTMSHEKSTSILYKNFISPLTPLKGYKMNNPYHAQVKMSHIFMVCLKNFLYINRKMVWHCDNGLGSLDSVGKKVSHGKSEICDTPLGALTGAKLLSQNYFEFCDTFFQHSQGSQTNHPFLSQKIVTFETNFHKKEDSLIGVSFSLCST
jgi:hypothetical protein